VGDDSPRAGRVRDPLICGWCARTTPPDVCAYCGHDPALPWLQRGQPVPYIESDAGRPSLDESEIRRRYDEAKRAGAVTVEQIAEALDRSPRTVRAWRRRYSLR